MHDKNMPGERMAFLTAINANPRERSVQLIFADWLDEHGEHRKANWFRSGLSGRGGGKSTWRATYLRARPPNGFPIDPVGNSGKTAGMPSTGRIEGAAA